MISTGSVSGGPAMSSEPEIHPNSQMQQADGRAKFHQPMHARSATAFVKRWRSDPGTKTQEVDESQESPEYDASHTLKVLEARALDVDETLEAQNVQHARGTVEEAPEARKDDSDKEDYTTDPGTTALFQDLPPPLNARGAGGIDAPQQSYGAVVIWLNLFNHSRSSRRQYDETEEEFMSRVAEVDEKLRQNLLRSTDQSWRLHRTWESDRLHWQMWIQEDLRHFRDTEWLNHNWLL